MIAPVAEITPLSNLSKPLTELDKSGIAMPLPIDVLSVLCCPTVLAVTLPTTPPILDVSPTPILVTPAFAKISCITEFKAWKEGIN